MCAGSESELVKVETVERVRLIGLNRPDKRNSVNHALATRLFAAFADFDSDDSVDSAVVYGEGPSAPPSAGLWLAPPEVKDRAAGGSFCAGYDLGEIAALEEGSELMRRFQEDADFFRLIVPPSPASCLIGRQWGVSCRGRRRCSRGSRWWRQCRGTRWRGAWSWRSWQTCASWRTRPSSASSAAASASPPSTGVRPAPPCPAPLCDRCEVQGQSVCPS